MICCSTNAATRRYTWRFVIALVFYVAFLFLAVWMFKNRHPSGVLAYVLAILPSLPIVAGLGIVGRYLAEEKDEFQRNLLIQSMIWAIGATLSVTTVWGFLENFVAVPHLDLFMVVPMFWAFVAMFSPMVRARYQ